MSPDDVGFRQNLAAAIVARRTKLQETQEHVARAIDVPLTVYRSWERERAIPRGAAFYRLCEHFDWPHPLRSGASETIVRLVQTSPDQAVSVIAPPAAAAGSERDLVSASSIAGMSAHAARHPLGSRSRADVAA